MQNTKSAQGRKEEILLAALAVAAEEGLAGLSMGRIAERAGLQKPSLYHYFATKEVLVEELYAFLRGRAKALTQTELPDYPALFSGRTAREVLQTVTDGYRRMSCQAEMQTFYKAVYAARCHHPVAARILAEETERMIRATRQLFYAMEVHHLLHFWDADRSALSFALTLHGLMDRAADLQMAGMTGEDLLPGYLDWFCNENAWEDETK